MTATRHFDMSSDEENVTKTMVEELITSEESENDTEDDFPMPPVYYCFHCSKKFVKYQSLDFHIKRTPIWELENALQNMKTLPNLENYISAINAENGPPTEEKNSSAISPKPYNNDISLSQQCPICHYASRTKAALKSHILIMHTDVRPFKCPLCEYRCLSKTKLKLHVMAIHTGEKPHACELCDYRATRKSHLSRHTARYHDPSILLKCPVCVFTCISRYHLERHVKNYHEPLDSPPH